MNEWKKCDGCGAKYRGNACPYCMTIENDYEETAGATESLYLYRDCWPGRSCVTSRPGQKAVMFEKSVKRRWFERLRFW